MLFGAVDRVFFAGLVSFAFEPMRELTNLLLSGPLARVVLLSSHGRGFESECSPETWQWLAFERAMEFHNAACVRLIPAGLFANVIDPAYPISGANWSHALSGAVRRESSCPMSPIRSWTRRTVPQSPLGCCWMMQLQVIPPPVNSTWLVA